MKKLISYLVVCIATLFLTISCAGDGKMLNLLEQVPADVDMVVTGNIETVLNSLGGKVEGSNIELPSYITKEFRGNDLKEWNELKSQLKTSGIDASSCAAVADFQFGSVIVLVELEDAEKFKNSVNEMGYSKSSSDSDADKDITIYSKTEKDEYWESFSYLAVKENYAFIMEPVYSENSAEEALNFLKNTLTEAEDKSFAETKFADYIISENVAGAMIKIPVQLKAELIEEGVPDEIADLFSGVICMKGGITNDEAQMSIKWFDEDGNEKDLSVQKELVDINAKVSTKALAFLNDDISYVAAVALKDVNWNKIMNQLDNNARLSDRERSTFAVVKSYLQKLDGTIAFGLGFKGGLEDLGRMGENDEEAFKNIAATFVCEVKSGKGSGLLSDMKKLLSDQNISYQNESNGLSVVLPNGAGNVYMKVVDNFVVMSTSEIKEYNNCKAVENIDFSDYSSGISLYVSKTNPLLNDLGVKYDLNCTIGFDAETQENTIKVKLDGNGEGGLFEKLAKILINIVHQEDVLESKFERYMKDSSYSDYAIDTTDVSDNYGYEEYDSVMVADSTTAW